MYTLHHYLEDMSDEFLGFKEWYEQNGPQTPFSELDESDQVAIAEQYQDYLNDNA